MESLNSEDSALSH